MDSPAAENSRRGMRRARKACSFCRQRKLRCDNQEPECGNCRTYERQCVFEATPTKAKYSARLRALEAENEHLHARFQTPVGVGSNHDVQQRDVSPEDHASISSSSNLDMSVAGADKPVQYSSYDSLQHQRQPIEQVTTSQEVRASSTRRLGSQAHESNYYGLTSALFDDSATDPKILSGVLSNTSMPVEWVKSGLIAEATRQRQLETFNYNTGRLDFDGVDPELGMHLLSLHWNRQHHSFLITYRPAFMRDMACAGPNFSKLLLNAIYFAASKFSNRLEVRENPEDARTVGRVYRRRVRDLLGESLDTSEITTIQALLVMTNSLFALGDERSAAWLYAGIALRMLVDLGMHVDSKGLSLTRRLNDEDLEIRRRVFWAAFVVDKVQSLYQGRPASLQDFDSRVPLTFLDHYEELEHWTPFAFSGSETYIGSPAYSVSTFTELCKLCVIMNRVLNKVYSEKGKKRKSQKLLDSRLSIQSELEKWRNFLPTHLNFDPLRPESLTPPPHVLSLLAMYNVLLILLHRPFVEDGHLYTTEPAIAIESFAICSTAAKAIVHLLRRYESTFSVRRAPYLISYATYVAATIHVRIAAQRRTGSDAHAALRTCLWVFDENQETNWAVRRAKLVVVNLMKRMNITLSKMPDEIGKKLVEKNTTLHENQNYHHRDYPRHSRRSIEAGSPSNYMNNSSVATAATVTEALQTVTTPELDMDMIIQSFVQEQGHRQPRVPPFQHSYQSEQYPFSNPVMPSYDQPTNPTTSLPQQSSMSSVTAGLANNNRSQFGEYDGVDSGMADFNYNAYDLLFGLNGSAQDEIWMDGFMVGDSETGPGAA